MRYLIDDIKFSCPDIDTLIKGVYELADMAAEEYAYEAGKLALWLDLTANQVRDVNDRLRKAGYALEDKAFSEISELEAEISDLKKEVSAYDERVYELSRDRSDLEDQLAEAAEQWYPVIPS